MSLHLLPTYEKFANRLKARNGSGFGWLIRQMSINQKSGRQTFRRRFVSMVASKREQETKKHVLIRVPDMTCFAAKHLKFDSRYSQARSSVPSKID